MREKLQVQLAAGVPLDVWEYAAIAETMAENDWLIPIDTYVARDQYDLTVFAPKLFDFYTRYDGSFGPFPGGTAAIRSSWRSTARSSMRPASAYRAPDLAQT